MRMFITIIFLFTLAQGLVLSTGHAASGIPRIQKVKGDDLKEISRTISIVDTVFFTWVRYIVVAVLIGAFFVMLKMSIMAAMMSFIGAVGLAFLPKITEMLFKLGGGSGLFN